MAWLPDTNILSERRKPKPEPKVSAFYEAQPLNALYISVMSIAEIRFGIELQQDVTRRRTLMEDGRKTGHAYSNPDILLAATALQHGITVVTRDRSDFDKKSWPGSGSRADRSRSCRPSHKPPVCRHCA